MEFRLRWAADLAATQHYCCLLHGAAMTCCRTCVTLPMKGPILPLLEALDVV